MKKYLRINVALDTETGKVTDLDVTGDSGRTECVNGDLDDPITLEQAFGSIWEELLMARG